MTYEPIEFEERVAELPTSARQGVPGMQIARLPSRYTSDISASISPTAAAAPVPLPLAAMQTPSPLNSLPTHAAPTFDRATIEDFRFKAREVIESSTTLQEAGTKYLEYLTQANPTMNKTIEQIAIGAIETAKLRPEHQRLCPEFSQAVRSWVNRERYTSPTIHATYQYEPSNSLKLSL